MESNLNLLKNVNEEDVNDAFELINSYSGVIATSVLASYEKFLEVVFSFIKDECKKENVDHEKIKRIISKAAKVINNAETSNVNKNRFEIKEIKREVISNLVDSNDANIDDFEFGVTNKLGIDLNDELYQFVKEKVTNSSFPKREIINYILEKNNILPKNSFESYKYNKNEFIEFMIKNRITNSITLSFEDIYSILCSLVEDEKQEYNRAMVYGLDRSGYESRYPSLARVLLLLNTKEEIKDLKNKYKNDEKFVEYLDLFLGSLSNYDKSFMNEMKVNIPVGRFKNAIRLILDREMSYNKEYLYNTSKTILSATSDGLEEKTNQVEGLFKVKEIMACLPDNYKDKMYNAYNEVEDNKYAILLSKVIAKYCTTKDGKKYTPSKVQVLLLNAYRQYIENLSKNMENKKTIKK